MARVTRYINGKDEKRTLIRRGGEEAEMRNYFEGLRNRVNQPNSRFKLRCSSKNMFIAQSASTSFVFEFHKV